MATSLKSKIMICKGIKLDKEYNNVLSYNTQTMLSLCESNSHLVTSASDYSFIRNRGTISVNFTYTQCLQSNYMAFQNKDYDNKWFFAFIDDVQYISNNCTEISYTIDAWTTFFDDWTAGNCFVIREHTNNDTIGANTIPENLDVGEVIQENETYDTSYGTGSGYYIIIASNYTIKDSSTGEEPDKSDRGIQYSGIAVYDNNVFGNQLFLFEINSELDFRNVFLFLLRTNSDGYINDVLNMFVLPDSFISASTLVSHTAQIVTSQQTETITWYTLPQDMTPQTFNTTINKRNSFTGVTIKNNKCFVYPYNYLLVTNNNGSNNIFKYEDFSTTNCVFENQLSIAVGGSARIVPKNYKGMAYNEDESLALGKYPTCAWSSDAYINWLTQNGVNMAINMGMAGASLATTFMTGGATLSTTLTASSSVLNAIGQFHQASLLPNINGGQATGDVLWSTSKNMFFFREMRCKNEYIKVIDDYFTRYRL